jgi:Ni/Co efflux regulator RcnB
MSGFAMNKMKMALSAFLLVVPLAAASASDSKSPLAKSGSSKANDDKRDDGKRDDDKRKDDKRGHDKHGHHKPDKICKPEKGGKSKCAGGGGDSR